MSSGGLLLSKATRTCPLCEVELQPQDCASHLDWHTSRMRNGSQDLTRQEILFIGETFAEFRSPGQNATSQVEEEAPPVESEKYKEMKARKARKDQKEQKKRDKGKLDTKPPDDNYNVDEQMLKLSTIESGQKSAKISSKKKKQKKKSSKGSTKDVAGLELSSGMEENAAAKKEQAGVLEAEVYAEIYLSGESELEKNSVIEQNADAYTGQKEQSEISEAVNKEDAKPKTKSEAFDNKIVKDVFMEPLKKEHARYLAAISSSNDASLSVGEIEECENMVHQLSSFAASEESCALNYKIVKAGINYAFTDAPVRLSFLTFAVLKFASNLPSDCIYDVLNDLQDQTKITNMDEDSTGWLPCCTSVDTLAKVARKEDPGSESVAVLAWEDFGAEGISNDFEASICEFYVSDRHCDEENRGNKLSSYQTGRKGESEAAKFFSSCFSNKQVEWVNESKETGLPYDIVLQSNDMSKEYIEVKSTSVENKEWFHVSFNEYLCARQQGTSYIIARVELASDGELTKITTYRDASKLLKSKKLKMKLIFETR